MTRTLHSAVPQEASPLVARLGLSVLLTAEEVDYLEAMQVNRVDLAKGDEFLRDGEEMRVTFLVREGWVMRYKLTSAGRRQIIGVSLPGDFIGLHVNFNRTSIYSVTALTAISLAMIEPVRILEIHRRFPVLASGLDWLTVRNSNILSEHKVSLGARTAAQRILHFLLEIWTRLAAVGLASQNGFALKLNQEQIADCMGLSSVHANRSLRRLSQDGLIRVDAGEVSFPKLRAAVQFADFDDAYLEAFSLGSDRVNRLMIAS